MRLRSIAPVVALAIVVAAWLVTPGAFGGQPRGRLDQGVVAAAERGQACSLSAGEVAVLRGADGAAPSRVAARKGIAGKVVAGGERFALTVVFVRISVPYVAIAGVVAVAAAPEAPIPPTERFPAATA